ncbi:5'-3' exonuclease H3TH domain-containing protein [Oceanicoccus sp. KOV_DT_Chl]|uniref:5'-3' exonuclease n=1 Tax=Oceanicoccus sp. KOV_DT_Chl TaxID=1904639 RepID=UPI000C7BC94C|nr:5'-3' exonuclease H3TH domain-containing protein [Oceanicoccus sp. KOV_DT_Chl]
MSSPVFLIDASIYIFRAYFAIPDEWHTKEGMPVNALYGYAQFMLKFLQAAKPEQLVVAYDESLGSCFRNDIYPDYKVSRALPDDTLAFQLQACKAFTEALGITSLADARYEADDIIATLATQAQQRQQAISIVSRDKDLGQLLLNEHDCLWDFAADKKNYQQQLYEHFLVRPDQLLDYLALLGDSVDDIPGVPGIGKKTAANLLRQFGSIENLFNDLDAVAQCGLRGAKSIALKLQHYRQQISMAQALVRLETAIPHLLDFDTTMLEWSPPPVSHVNNFFADYSLEKRFKSQLSRCYWWQ